MSKEELIGAIQNETVWMWGSTTTEQEKNHIENIFALQKELEELT